MLENTARSYRGAVSGALNGRSRSNPTLHA
jgi:hypothetical protein